MGLDAPAQGDTGAAAAVLDNVVAAVFSSFALAQFRAPRDSCRDDGDGDGEGWLEIERGDRSFARVAVVGV